MALENFLYSGHDEIIEIDHRFDEVIKAVMIDPESDYQQDVVQALLDAYWAAIRMVEEQTDETIDVKAMSGAEAEKYMADLFYKHTPYNWDDCAFTWPEALPMSQREQYPKKMMNIIAKCLIQRDRAYRSAMMKYMADEKVAEATS